MQKKGGAGPKVAKRKSTAVSPKGRAAKKKKEESEEESEEEEEGEFLLENLRKKYFHSQSVFLRITMLKANPLSFNTHHFNVNYMLWCGTVCC